MDPIESSVNERCAGCGAPITERPDEGNGPYWMTDDDHPCADENGLPAPHTPGGSMSTTTIPTIDQVAHVTLHVNTEVLIGENPTWDLATAKQYAAAITDALDESDSRRNLVYVSDEPEDSEYGIEGQVYAIHAAITLDPDEWLRVAEALCLDLDYVDGVRLDRTDLADRARIPVLPEDDIAPTMGVLTADGVIPAVALHETDHGWGQGGYEPSIVASFYVSVGLA